MVAATNKVLREFETYIRPVIEPWLTPCCTQFCTRLTGITDVASAPAIQEAVDMFAAWVEVGMGFDPATVAVATDGPWDIRTFCCYR